LEKKHQIWDKLFKVVGDYFPNELLDFLFHDTRIQFCGKFEQERIVLEYQIADINFWVQENGVKKLLNIEPYSSWNRQSAAEVFTRNAIISKSLDYQHDVISVVVLLDNKEEAGTYGTSLGNHENRYHFPIFNIAEVEEILKNYPPLAPFLLKVDLKYQERVLKAVKGHKILKYVTTLILSQLGIPQEEALKMVGAKLEEFRELMEIPIMRSLIQEIEEKRKREIAKNLLKAGVDKQIIANATGLLLEEVKKIKVKS
jgi:hypothetical protein